MKNRLLTLAGALLLLAVLGKFYATPLMAQIRATLIQNRDEPARNLYEMYRTCTDSGNKCTVNYPAIPANKRLILTHVSGYALGAGVLADHVNGGVLSRETGDMSRKGLVASLQGSFTTTPGGRWSVNQEVLTSFEAGEAPSIEIETNATGWYVGLFHISGYMIDVP